MARMNLKRWLLVLAIVAAMGAAGLFAAFRYATQLLKEQVVAALGPQGSVGEIRVGLDSVEVSAVRVGGPETKKSWPVEDQLRAARIVVRPDLSSMLSGNVRVAAITVEGGYLSMLRTKDGKLRVLPALLDKPKPEGGAAPPAISIGRVELKDSAIEFYDATVRQPPLRIRLEQIDARLDELRLPALDGQSALALEGVLKGAKRDGKVGIKGRIELSSRDSELTSTLRGVDLVALEPYLVKAADTGVAKGSLDLDVKSTIRRNVLQAPGTLVISDLELAPGGGFMGMSRQAVVGALKDRNNKIGINFNIEGNLDDPKFSLNESIATRFGASMADTLGVSLEGLAQGVSSVGSSAAKGVSEAMGKLFGK